MSYGIAGRILAIIASPNVISMRTWPQVISPIIEFVVIDMINDLFCLIYESMHSKFSIWGTGS